MKPTSHRMVYRTWVAVLFAAAVASPAVGAGPDTPPIGPDTPPPSLVTPPRPKPTPPRVTPTPSRSSPARSTPRPSRSRSGSAPAQATTPAPRRQVKPPHKPSGATTGRAKSPSTSPKRLPPSGLQAAAGAATAVPAAVSGTNSKLALLLIIAGLLSVIAAAVAGGRAFPRVGEQGLEPAPASAAAGRRRNSGPRRTFSGRGTVRKR